MTLGKRVTILEQAHRAAVAAEAPRQAVAVIESFSSVELAAALAPFFRLSHPEGAGWDDLVPTYQAVYDQRAEWSTAERTAYAKWQALVTDFHERLAGLLGTTDADATLRTVFECDAVIEALERRLNVAEEGTNP